MGVFGAPCSPTGAQHPLDAQSVFVEGGVSKAFAIDPGVRPRCFSGGTTWTKGHRELLGVQFEPFTREWPPPTSPGRVVSAHAVAHCSLLSPFPDVDRQVSLVVLPVPAGLG